MTVYRWKLAVAVLALGVIASVAPATVASAEVPGAPVPVVRIGSTQIMEPDLNQPPPDDKMPASVPVRLSQPSPTEIKVTVQTVPGTAVSTVQTAPGTAVSPADFKPVTVTLKFPACVSTACELTQYVNPEVKQDGMLEPTEHFSVVITSVVGAATAGNTSGQVEILDNQRDATVDPPMLYVPDMTYWEPDALYTPPGATKPKYNAQAYVISTQPLQFTAGASWTSGTATNGALAGGGDWAPALATSFTPPGANKTRAVRDFNIWGDTVGEPDEEFTIAVAPGASWVVGKSGTITILNDDANCPTEPLTPIATAGDTTADLSWTAPASNGGAPITDYIVTTYIGGIAQAPTVTVGSAATSLTLTGLTNGTTYTYTVQAVNAACPAGGLPSTASADFTPMSAATPNTFTDIDGGEQHTCAITTTGTIKCWGLNSFGQLGDGSNTDSATPVDVDMTGVLAGETPTDIDVGFYHSCVTTASAKVACWGYNNDGELGNASTASSNVPVWVSLPSGTNNVKYLSAGDYHTCAVLRVPTIFGAGQVWCWGRNVQGQLGNGTTTGSSIPVEVAEAGTELDVALVTDLSAGGFHTCAAVDSNKALCWGSNSFGENGNLAMGTNALTPETVVDVGGSQLNNVTAIAAGRNTACAKIDTAQLSCWGRHNGTPSDIDGAEEFPLAGTALDGAAIDDVGAGFDDVCALTTGGLVACWGDDTYGQLGQGGTGIGSSLLPVPVPLTGPGDALDGKTVVQLAVGAGHTCALASDGTAACWGYNSAGQVGNGAPGIDVFTPTVVV